MDIDLDIYEHIDMYKDIYLMDIDTYTDMYISKYRCYLVKGT